MKSRRLLALTLSISGLFAYAGDSISLACLDLSKVNQAYGEAVAGKSVYGENALVGKQMFTDVIGTHAPSAMKIDLHGKATRFSAKVAIANRPATKNLSGLERVTMVNGSGMVFRKDGLIRRFVGVTGKGGTIEKGSAVIIVKGDGKELYRSRVIRGGDKPADIDLDLKGVRMLELISEPTDDGPSGDYVLWISPSVDYSGEKPVAVATASLEKGPE